MLFLLVAVFMYFLPTLVGRHRHDAAGIFLLNFLLGWTLIGWVAAMIWACMPEARIPVLAVAGPAHAYAFSNSRYCPQCGALSHGGARYCWSCGRCI